MIIAIVPLLFALLGLLMYVLASSAKLVRIGEIVFFCGFLVTMMTMASKVLRLG